MHSIVNIRMRFPTDFQRQAVTVEARTHPHACILLIEIRVDDGSIANLAWCVEDIESASLPRLRIVN